MAWAFFGLVLGVFLGGSIYFAFYFPVSTGHGPKQQVHTSHPIESSKGEPRGTESSPFFVQVLPTPKSAEERAQEAEDRDEKKAAERDLVRWTLALFLATVGLMIATGVLGFFAFRQASDMKATIELNREEFLSTHRPKIRVKHFWVTGDVWGGERIIANLTCVNTGTTEAILQEIGIRFYVVANDRPIPFDRQITPALPLSGRRLQSGVNGEVEGIPFDMVISDEQNVQIQQGRSKLYCVGFISYQDGAERLRITGFCRVMTFPDNALPHADNIRFRTFEDRDYEYED